MTIHLSKFVMSSDRRESRHFLYEHQFPKHRLAQRKRSKFYLFNLLLTQFENHSCPPESFPTFSSCNGVVDP